MERHAKAGVSCYIIVVDRNRMDGRMPQFIAYWLSAEPSVESVYHMIPHKWYNMKERILFRIASHIGE